MIPTALDQGNTYLCASYCMAYGLKHRFGIDLDINWFPAMRSTWNASLSQHLHVLQTYGALPTGGYSVPPFVNRDLAVDWLTPQRSLLISKASKYKCKEWKQITTVEDIYDSLKSGWYVVFLATQYKKEKFKGNTYLPYDGEEYSGTHAMSLWLIGDELWILNSHGTSWGENGMARISATDVLRSGQCYAYKFDEPEKEDNLRETKYISGVSDGNVTAVRAEANSTSDKVGTLKNGESVTVLDVEGDRALVSTGTCGYILRKYLADKPPDEPENDIGTEPEDESKKLQWYLHKWGFGALVGGIDGKVGSKTKAALKQFQAAMGLSVDGIAGRNTWSALIGDVIVPRITEADMACQCGKYCNGYPNPCTTGIRILIERIWRELEDFYPGVHVYVTNNATPAPDGAVAGGQRCEQWNRLRGGATNSQHRYGTAADIYGKMKGIPDSEIRKKIEDIALRMNTKGGVGYGARYIVHIDIRGYKARWEY